MFYLICKVERWKNIQRIWRYSRRNVAIFIENWPKTAKVVTFWGRLPAQMKCYQHHPKWKSALLDEYFSTVVADFSHAPSEKSRFQILRKNHVFSENCLLWKSGSIPKCLLFTHRLGLQVVWSDLMHPTLRTTRRQNFSRARVFSNTDLIGVLFSTSSNCPRYPDYLYWLILRFLMRLSAVLSLAILHLPLCLTTSYLVHHYWPRV